MQEGRRKHQEGCCRNWTFNCVCCT
ncbi:hypothetical protein LINGRAPRIM_LOCUS1830 [Linum grandiflorum]